MDFYLIPFAKKVLDSTPHIDDFYIPHLEKEMKRLNLINKPSKTQKEKGKTKPSNGNKEKCINDDCKHHKTVDIANVKAYGQCDVCENFEHFQCAGTTSARREDIA